MENCVLCLNIVYPPNSELIILGEHLHVVLVPDPDLPGACRVIWNRHVAEMTELSSVEREHLMSVVFAVEKAVSQVMQPHSINIAYLGNMEPHIHWHVVPRFQDDVFFPGSPWGKRGKETPADVLSSRKQKALALPEAMKSAISALN